MATCLLCGVTEQDEARLLLVELFVL